jgi:hypothetical protein
MYTNNHRNRKFNQAIQKILFAPILVHMRLNKISFNDLSIILCERGYRYTRVGLNAVCYGHSSASLNINYFGIIYDVLNLPLPDFEGVYFANVKAQELREEKKARAEANKAKKQKNID